MGHQALYDSSAMRATKHVTGLPYEKSGLRSREAWQVFSHWENSARNQRRPTSWNIVVENSSLRAQSEYAPNLSHYGRQGSCNTCRWTSGLTYALRPQLDLPRQRAQLEASSAGPVQVRALCAYHPSTVNATDGGGEGSRLSRGGGTQTNGSRRRAPEKEACTMAVERRR